MTEPHPARLSITVATDVPTAFADFASVWHTADVFVLDFISQDSPPQQVDSADGPITSVPATVVQRVRIPPRQVFELMKAMESQLSQWEAEIGQDLP